MCAAGYVPYRYYRLHQTTNSCKSNNHICISDVYSVEYHNIFRGTWYIGYVVWYIYYYILYFTVVQEIGGNRLHVL